MAKSKKSVKPNPALKHLEVFVGDWGVELSRASFLPEPKTKIHGAASFAWVENGAFLIMYQGEKGVPQATWLIGQRTNQATCTASSTMMLEGSRGHTR